MAITAKNFTVKLNAFTKKATTMRDDLQELIVYGLEVYRDKDANADPLTRVLNTCIGIKALPTQSIKQYIQMHANLKWTKSKGGDQMVFKKDGDEVEVTIPEEPWYEYTQKDQAKPDLDAVAAVRSLVKRLEKNMQEKHVKDMNEAKRLHDGLAKLIAAA